MLLGVTSERSTDPRGPWIFVALICIALSTLPFLAIGVVSALVRGVSGDPATDAASDSLALLPHPAELVTLMTFAAPVWLVGAIATALVPDISTRTRLLLAGCGPATLAAVLVGMANAGGFLALVDALIIAAVGWVVVSMLRRAHLEAEGPTAA